MNNLMFVSRTLSHFSLSIGTGLALRPFFSSTGAKYKDGEGETPFTPMDLGETDVFLFNVATLMRNILSAVQFTHFEQFEAQALYLTVEEEIEVIKDLFKNNGTICKPVFYYRDYAAYTAKYAGLKKTKFKSSTSPRVIKEEALILQVTKALKKSGSAIEFTKSPVNNRALILSHYCNDLLAYPKFRQLLLVESHTSQILGRDKWNKKYHRFGDRDLSSLPFLKNLYWVFGDNTLVQPESSAKRLALLELAERARWTPATTADKVIANVSHLSDKDLFNLMVAVR